MQVLRRGITRREMLKMGALGGAALFLPFGRSALAAHDTVSSPSFTPYSAALRIPGVLQPVRSTETTDFYEITMKEGLAEIIPGLSTPIWGYNGLYPGPTIVTRSGREVVVKHTNNLPVPTSIHTHGAYVDGDSDGHPLDLIQPGGSKEYVFGNKQNARTQWYHDHAMHITSTNVYRGLSGVYVIKDDLEDDLPLPKGEYDVPLVIQDRLFNADGSLHYPPDAVSNAGFQGDVAVVNGVARPRLEVAARRYRFRILNGSNARPYNLALGSGKPFTVIATEGGLLEHPVTVTTLPIAPAERYELVIDFGEYGVGDKIVLENRRVPRGEATREIMRFDVVRQESDNSRVPEVLRPEEFQYDDTHLPPEPDNVAVNRQFRFDKDGPMYTINGLIFDKDRIDANPREGDTEIWTVYNNSSGWVHPVHLHLVNYRILSRNGQPPHPWERGWKETVLVGEGETVRIMMRWPKVPAGPNPGDFTYRYVFHCHNLEHEDHDMMAQIGVRPAEVSVPSLSAEPGAGTFDGPQTVKIVSSDPDARIYYTTDGSKPTTKSAVNSDPIAVNGSQTIRAMAVNKTGYRSPIASWGYVIRHPTALELAAGAAALDFGKATTLSGRLSAGGQALSGKMIVLEQRPAGGSAFAPLPGGELTTGPGGAFSLAGIKPQRNTEYRARFDGDGEEIQPSASSIRRVNVRAAVALRLSSRTVRRGRRLAISGTVNPAHKGGVVLAITRNGRRVLSRAVGLKSSRYSFAYTPRQPGRYAVTVSFPNDADHLGGSARAGFRVIR